MYSYHMDLASVSVQNLQQKVLRKAAPTAVGDSKSDHRLYGAI